MLGSTVENAQMLLDLYHGNYDNAMIELYNQSRAYPNVQCRYFHDCANLLRAWKRVREQEEAGRR